MPVPSLFLSDLPFINVASEGIPTDGVTPISAALQALIDRIDCGILCFPFGDFRLDQTIRIEKNGIIILGSAHFGNTNVGDPIKGTNFLWYGPTFDPGNEDARMFDFSPVDDSASSALKGCGMEACRLDGRDLAGTGIRVRSTQYSFFKRLGIFSTRLIGLGTGCVTATLLDDKGCSNNVFEQIIIRNTGTFSGATGVCLKVAGDPVFSNTHNNDWNQIYLIHKNAAGAQFYNNDNQRFHSIRVVRDSSADLTLNGGNGAYGIELHGSNIEAAPSAGYSRDICRSNIFTYMTAGKGGLKVFGTSTYTYPADRNIVVFYSTDNGEPFPSVDNGAFLTVMSIDTGRSISNLWTSDTQSGAFGNNTQNYHVATFKRRSPADFGDVVIGLSHHPQDSIGAMFGGRKEDTTMTGGTMSAWIGTRNRAGRRERRWMAEADGDWLPYADNRYSIGSRTLRPPRIYSRRLFSVGTPLVAGDVALDAGWGSGASVSSISGNDGAFSLDILAGSSPTANPLFTLTFKDGAWDTNPPVLSLTPGDATSGWFVSSVTTTAAVIGYKGTPVNGTHYKLTAQARGI